MKRELLVALVVVVFAFAAPAQAGARTYIDTRDSRIEFLGSDLIVGGIYDGMYEYWYDVYRGGHTWSARIRLEEFDATLIANNGPAGPEKWDLNAGNPGTRLGGGSSWFDYTSYWDIATSSWTDASNWGYEATNYYTQPGNPPSIDNKYHTDSQPYTDMTSYDVHKGPDVNTFGMYWNANGGGYRVGTEEDLVLTFRIVHPNPPGTVRWNTYANYATSDLDVYGYITGPGTTVPPAPGDFDDDGDVDADDINDLCANITGSGNPANDPKYDLDGDGDTDQDDMDMMIHDLVEITGGDGTGTEYGDFDLDGDIDTTDLTILATNFGLGTTWLEGNANCDLVINTTDLAILATNFGFVASGAVPEPATMSLLALGGLAVLRRRKS